MPTRAVKRSKPKPRSGRPAPEEATDVVAFIKALKHPREAEILALRKIILGVDKTVAEGIKWNSPSFHTTLDFATFHLRSKDGTLVILHRGSTPEQAKKAMTIDDPAGMLAWRGTSRALITFKSVEDVVVRKAAFIKILKQWIPQL